MGFKGLFPKVKSTCINIDQFIQQYNCNNLGVDYYAFCYFIEGIQKELNTKISITQIIQQSLQTLQQVNEINENKIPKSKEEKAVDKKMKQNQTLKTKQQQIIDKLQQQLQQYQQQYYQQNINDVEQAFCNEDSEYSEDIFEEELDELDDIDDIDSDAPIVDLEYSEDEQQLLDENSLINRVINKLVQNGIQNINVTPVQQISLETIYNDIFANYINKFQKVYFVRDGAKIQLKEKVLQMRKKQIQEAQKQVQQLNKQKNEILKQKDVFERQIKDIEEKNKQIKQKEQKVKVEKGQKILKTDNIFMKINKVAQNIEKAKQVLKTIVEQQIILREQQIQQRKITIALYKIQQLKQAIEKLQQQAAQVQTQNFKLSDETFQLLKQHLDSDRNKFISITAPFESDQQLSILEKTNQIDCIYSNDSDILALGARYLIQINKNQYINYQLNLQQYYQLYQLQLQYPWCCDLIKQLSDQYQKDIQQYQNKQCSLLCIRTSQSLIDQFKLGTGEQAQRNILYYLILSLGNDYCQQLNELLQHKLTQEQILRVVKIIANQQDQKKNNKNSDLLQSYLQELYFAQDLIKYENVLNKKEKKKITKQQFESLKYGILNQQLDLDQQIKIIKKILQVYKKKYSKCRYDSNAFNNLPLNYQLYLQQQYQQIFQNNCKDLKEKQSKKLYKQLNSDIDSLTKINNLMNQILYSTYDKVVIINQLLQIDSFSLFQMDPKQIQQILTQKRIKQITKVLTEAQDERQVQKLQEKEDEKSNAKNKLTQISFEQNNNIIEQEQIDNYIFNFLQTGKTGNFNIDQQIQEVFGENEDYQILNGYIQNMKSIGIQTPLLEQYIQNQYMFNGNNEYAEIFKRTLQIYRVSPVYSQNLNQVIQYNQYLCDFRINLKDQWFQKCETYRNLGYINQYIDIEDFGQQQNKNNIVFSLFSYRKAHDLNKWIFDLKNLGLNIIVQLVQLVEQKSSSMPSKTKYYQCYIISINGYSQFTKQFAQYLIEYNLHPTFFIQLPVKYMVQENQQLQL